MKTTSYWFAVRKSDGNEWLDINTWGFEQITAKEKSLETDAKIPKWAKDNPVVRCSQFRFTEIESDCNCDVRGFTVYHKPGCVFFE